MNFLTELKEGLFISLDAIRAHKLRATLTTLGIVIGIITVTLMTTAITGTRRAFMESLSSLGGSTLSVGRMDQFINSPAQWLKQNRRPLFSMDQIRDLERQCKFAVAIAPQAVANAPVKYRDRRADSASVLGTTDPFAITAGATVAEGRFFSSAESDGARPVCVIGAQVATNLFMHEPAVGNRIKVGRQQFEVLGVLDKQGEAMGGPSLDNQIVIPIGQFAGEFIRDPDYTIQIKVSDLTSLEDAKEELRGLLRKIRRLPPGAEDNFSINAADTLLTTFNRVGGTIAGAGLFITGLALFVGGIGIMNIMFVSVAERTKEIGIRKAIGAKRRTILIQFLTESACICLLGGLIALTIAWPATLILDRFLPATLSPTIVGLALLMSLLTGVVSGFVPAWRAARMNPIDALRAE
jgi:putative ABC transport system permease protein